ncbi:4-hydroxyphenylpyruvate dioxygenase [Roseateles sp. YR242]|uniref:4-hydroxyphenylpyruvate dioxygenase n=1 Tax=Roseateles sp. YR242 TaxID=1855305 RepID=UPI0008C6FD66|nr:4-hydroxyphenylpyruvate dioxygenase [Roseateles sp. YR242]SEL67410.1 4-hydroxyphenylpyruvate dioxygenase [Roseateles sp. YR242]
MELNLEREGLQAGLNPLGMEGVEFIEYTTARPQALGRHLEAMGFQLIARHRSREVLLYRQGGMNVIVNAHGAEASGGDAAHPASPSIAALAFRVRDAASAYRQAIERGAWAVPTQVEVMELNIPAIHGVGSSRIYFVDRYREFSIYDVDFIPIPGVERHPPALAGLHLFGAVQYIAENRTNDWTEFYAELFGFTDLPDEQRFGILPRGRVLRSPCGSFHLQLIEPWVEEPEFGLDEYYARLGLGTPDVMAAVQALTARGVRFFDADAAAVGPRGALTHTELGSVSFELVPSSASTPPGAVPPNTIPPSTIPPGTLASGDQAPGAAVPSAGRASP